MKTKFRNQIKLIIFFLIVIQNIGIACFCVYEPVFCKNVENDHNIVKVIVTSSTSQFQPMEVKILENIHNEIIEDTVLIYGQDRVNCGERLDQFSINDTLVLAVTNLQLNGIEYWYLEGECGLHFLRYENGIVSGQITDSITTQPVQDFKDNLFSCLDINVPVKEIESWENLISVIPNPTQGNLQIVHAKTKVNGYEIYNSSGQLLMTETLTKSIENIHVNLNQLSKGIYYLRIITSKGILARKILKL